MDRESRRNSILKPSFGQALFDGDEENNYTEVTHTFQRRKSLKRVSFAGRDQIKEFEKHEALVDKAQLTEVFNKLKDVSADNVDMVLESEKENISKNPQSVVNFEVPKLQIDDEDMELTTTLSAFKPIQVVMQQTVVNEVEMEVTTLCSPLGGSVNDQEEEASLHNIPSKTSNIVDPPAQLGVNMNETEMSIVQEDTMHGIIFPANSTCISDEKMEISASILCSPTPVKSFVPEPLPVNEPILPTAALSAVVEPVLVKEEIKIDVPHATGKPHLFPSVKATKKVEGEEKPEKKPGNLKKTSKKAQNTQEEAPTNNVVLQKMKDEEVSQVMLPVDSEKAGTRNEAKDFVDANAAMKKVETGKGKEAVKMTKKVEVEEKPQIKDFMDEWTPEFDWQASRNDNELVLTKLRNCLTLRLELKYEYLQQNVRHYVVEDIEVETKRGLKNIWARFGLNVLENTLEGCALKTKCSTTQDLDKLLRFVQDYIVLFEEFMLHGSEDFEWMTDPRTLQIDIENSTVSFEKSNLENLILIRITLKLNGVFPLSAADTRIETEIGTINKSELISMISAISPTGLYLLRVAECVEDYLKFPPVRNECGILDLTRS